MMNAYSENPTNQELLRAGSCMIGCLIIEEDCYVINVGDSRALLSSDRGKNLFVLSWDHKPSDKEEM